MFHRSSSAGNSGWHPCCCTDEGILVLRRDLTIDWWNSSAASLLGLRSSDRGSAVINLIRDPEFVEYIHQDEFIGSIELSSIIQSERLLKLSASRFGANEIALVITDITRIKSLEQLRKEFVGNVSHEYNVLDDIESSLKGMLKPEYEEA